MSDCKEAKANKPSGSLSSTKLTHRLQKLHTPSNKMMPERPAGNSKPGGMGPERGPVTANNGVVVRRARCGTAAMKVTARARASIFALLAARKTHGRLAGHLVRDEQHFHARRFTFWEKSGKLPNGDTKYR